MTRHDYCCCSYYYQPHPTTTSVQHIFNLGPSVPSIVLFFHLLWKRSEPVGLVEWGFYGSDVLQAGSDSSPVSERLYLSDYCVPAAGVDTQQHLCSTNRQLLAVPRYQLNTFGRRTFLVAGRKVWNSLPDFIRDPTISADCFRRLLKTYLFTWY